MIKAVIFDFDGVIVNSYKWKNYPEENQLD